MSVWDDFKSLNQLKLSFSASAAAVSGIIYGNSRNQVAITVQVKVLGTDGQPLPLTADDLMGQVELVSYQTGLPLRLDGNGTNFRPWAYTTTADDFVGAVTYSSVTNTVPEQTNADLPFYCTETAGTGTVYLSYFIYAEDAADGLDVAVSINAPGVGKFDTTASGTTTKNGPGGNSGSVFKSPSYVHLSALQAVGYGRDDINIYDEDLGKRTAHYKGICLEYRQHNAYLSLNAKGAYISKYENSDYASSDNIFNKYWICYNNDRPSQSIVPAYLWPQDTAADYSIAQYVDGHGGDSNFAWYVPAHLNKVSHPHAINLTILYYHGWYTSISSVARYDATTTFYDQYGNKGVISYYTKNMTANNGLDFTVYLKS